MTTTLKAHAWTRRARLLVFLVLAVTVTMLAVAATASAKVDKKYAKAYAGEIKTYQTLEDDHRDTYNAYVGSIKDLYDDMLPLINSTEPADQIALAVDVQAAQDDAQEYLDDYGVVSKLELHAVQNFYPHRKNWFGKAADRAAFHTACKDLAVRYKDLDTAMNTVYGGFVALSNKNLPLAHLHGNDAGKLVTKAEPVLTGAFAALRNLQR